MQEEGERRGESRVIRLQPRLAWPRQARVMWVVPDALGTSQAAWSLGRPGAPDSKVPNDLSSPSLKWV